MGDIGVKHRIYADHAATTPLMPEALGAMLPFMKGDFGNPSSIHSCARKPREAVREARATIAECIGAEPEEIFFTSGGTEADNWAIKGSAGGLLVSAYEHHAVLNAAAHEARRGRLVAYARPTRDGVIGVRQIADAWQKGIGLVSVMTANNEIGTVNDVGALAAEAHSRGALFHTDAVQAVGHIPIDARKLDVDFLSASAHKFNGPKGIGFLFVRKGLKLASLLDGGQQEDGRRAGTENVAAIVGMAAALKANCARMARVGKRLYGLAERLRGELVAAFPDAVFPGAGAPRQLPGFVSVALPGRSGEGLVHILDLKGIAVSAGAACDSRNTQVSHVLKAIRLPVRLAKGVIRISLGAENTLEDVRRIVDAMR